MTISDRQQRLFVAEDWTKLYQSFRNANFDSYDFDTIRRSMINYLQLNYPEDFNDFIESSEFVSLIDLIAYVSQSISYRVDLNARENFLGTAQRRDSVLRLARFLNYKPKRNQTIQGLMKITGISTTEPITDSMGNVLSNTLISWNDPVNTDYVEQFTVILNAAIISPQQIGKPVASKNINNIKTDLYRFNIPNRIETYVRFNQLLEGQSLVFEFVGADISDKDQIYESSPGDRNFGFLHRNDGRGNGSPNTGFFMYFKQGSRSSTDLSFPYTIPNDIQQLSVININDTDVWLYQLDQFGNLSSEWTKLESSQGTNVIYNSLALNNRKIYAVQSNDFDQIQLEFGDGIFSDMPVGNFRVYYRQSDSVTSTITSSNFSDQMVNIPYIDKNGNSQTLALTLSLTNSYNNGAATEDQNDIAIKAPMGYYTQNRMVTGEDYTVFPLTISQNIIKVKAVNRTSSGISEYFDLIDPTQKYSSTVDFASDGFLYQEKIDASTNFTFITRNDIRNAISTKVENYMKSVELRNFYLYNFPLIDVSSMNVTWHLSTETNGGCTGYFMNSLGSPQIIGSYTSSDLKYIESDAFLNFTSDPMDSNYQIFTQLGSTVSFSLAEGTTLSSTSVVLVNNVIQTFGIDYYTNGTKTVITFVVAPALNAVIKILPTKLYFTPNGQIIPSTTIQEGFTDNKWLSSVTIVLDGTNNGQGNLLSGLGPVELNQYLPNTAKIKTIFPKFITNLSESMINQMILLIENYRNFGLSYDSINRTWNIVLDSNLNSSGEFSLSHQGDVTNSGLDASWLIKLINDGTTYTITSRGLRYVFGSALEHRFYFEGSDKIYDYKLGSVVRDHVTVNRTNIKPNSSDAILEDLSFLVYGTIIDSDGFINNDRILVNFYDANENTVPDHPDAFTLLVGTNSFVFFKKIVDAGNFPRLTWINKNNFIITNNHSILTLSNYINGQLVYDYTVDKFYKLNSGSLIEITDGSYVAKVGRDDLNFEHIHYALNNKRIDPSSSNIMELYVLTQNYDTAFRAWIYNGQIGSMPIPPSSDDLNLSYGSLENYKSISDEIVFFPVTYKSLFGSTADPQYQAMFKVIKNTNATVSDNEIKSTLISYINQYFSLGNFDFGDTFYFTELVSYLHQNMSGIANSIVIVPNDPALSFGGLFEIKSQANELFISTATVENVSIIQGISSENIKASGAIT